MDSGSARLASGQLAKRLVAAVQRWVTALGPRTRQVLAVGAVLGRSFSLENVAALLGETPARLPPDVEAALGADLLVATPESLTFDRESGVAGARRERPPAGPSGAAQADRSSTPRTRGELADRVLAALVPAGGSGDDILVLTYRQPPAPQG